MNLPIFWSLAAGLALLALAFVLVPLWRGPGADVSAPGRDALNLAIFRRRLAELEDDLASSELDRAQFDSARRDLERELLADIPDARTGASPLLPEASARRPWALMTLLAILVPGLAIFGYLRLGTPGIIPLLETAAQASDSAPRGAPSVDAARLDELIKGLEVQLEQQPNNVRGWLLLGRTRFALDQPQQGLAAVEQAYRLAPEQVEVMLAYAQALAAAGADQRMAGKAAELVARAIAREPDNPTARWLAGMLALERGDREQAIALWQRLLSELPPDSTEARNLSLLIERARMAPNSGEESAVR